MLSLLSKGSVCLLLGIFALSSSSSNAVSMNRSNVKSKEVKEKDDRRSALRLPVATLVHVTSSGIHITTEAVVNDVSIDGIGGFVNYPYQKGDKLLVKMKLSTPSKKVIRESLIGWIAWVSKVDGEEKYAFGLEFREMEKQQPRLYAYLQGLEEISHPG